MRKRLRFWSRKDKMRAAATNQELLAGFPNVSVLYNIEPKEIVGDEKHVNGIKLYNTKTQNNHNHAH